MDRANQLIADFDPKSTHTIFSTKDQKHAKQQYFLDSGDKIRFFFENGALDNNGNLTTEKKHAINKIGHALHEHDPVFHCFSHSHQIAKYVASIGIINPLLVQSMYICKQPLIGGEVTPHQDATYLYVENGPIIGLWFALENATIENGCLWAIPGEHQTPLKSRFRRKKDNTHLDTFDETPWELAKMIPLEVSRGSLIILHGLLPHMSHENTSTHSRHAYSLHLMSGEHTFAADNWLQRINPFTPL
jgi:phytanoyl-CoA hydroxylase